MFFFLPEMPCYLAALLTTKTKKMKKQNLKNLAFTKKTISNINAIHGGAQDRRTRGGCVPIRPLTYQRTCPISACYECS